MRELLEYIKLRHKDNPSEMNAASEILEYMSPFIFLIFSNEYKVAKDLLYLKKCIDTDTFSQKKIRSKFIMELVKKYNISTPLEKEGSQTIANNIIEPNKYYITAIFIADIVRKEAAQEKLKWVITILISILTVIASYNWLLKDTL
jgi:hypothetical protein